jgi:hypothetical protein
VASSILFFGVSLLFLLLIPLTARADNCSSRTDCWPTPWPAAAGAAGVGGAAMMNRNRPKPPDKPSIKKARDATDLLSKAPGLKHLPIQKKLVGALLGAQFDAANEISRQLGDDPPRDDFQELAVAVSRPRPPIPHADLLGPEMTAAIEKSYEAHQALVAAGEAAVISFDRYGGARRAGAREWVEKQARAVIEHKKAMAPALRAASDAIQEAWRLAESFKPTGNVPDSILDHLTAADIDYARGLGLDEAAVRNRAQAMAADRGIPEDEDIVRIQAAYRSLAGSFERLPFPAIPAATH